MIKANRYLVSKIYQCILFTFAFAVISLFAVWWFDPIHIPDNYSGYKRVVDVLLFITVSYIIWHPIIMDVLSWFIALHIKDIHQQKPVPGQKVAFITTIVPSNEPLELLHKCLPAMVRATYKHDTWLLDEENSPEAQAICRKYGVKYFTRYGKSEYNTKTGMFTRTKGGNHNSWYDTHGKEYDFVAQIDTDFVPKSTFLTKTIGHFKDPDIAFVGTPQIYGNTKHSLIAKGASEQQYNFYGSVLRGLSGMGMTLLIGANHVVRVEALKDVRYYSGHITEDLLTGMKFHTRGWKSIYLPFPLAIGEAPTTWEAYFNQQMRWAYGCTDILLHHSPRLFKRMNLRRTLHYFFLQQHYFSGIAMVLSIILLNMYFFFGIRAAHIDLGKFAIFYSGIFLGSWLMSLWHQRFNVYRKEEAEMLLAGNIISIAVWPVWFLAIIGALTGKRLKYKVTPKGESESVRTPPLIFIPHIIIGMLSIAGIIASHFTHNRSPIMIFWAASSAFFMFSVPFSQRIYLAFIKKRDELYGLLQLIYTYRMQKKVQKKEKTRIPTVQSASIPSVLQSQNREDLKRTRKRQTITDLIFLAAVVTISCLPYITKLGFYGDDWAFLGNFTLSHSKSLIGLFKTASTPNTMMRPMQNLYDVVLFLLFGTHPLGYQLINTGVFITTVLLFYYILKKLGLPRIIAVAVPLVYAFLPNYSSDRFWYAAFQANLSMLLFAASFASALKAFSKNESRRSFWKTTSIVSLILSSLSYEVVLPLVILNMGVYIRPKKRLKQIFSGKKSSLQNHTVFLTLMMISLIYILLFKAMTTTRLGTLRYPGYLEYVIASAFTVNYGTFFLHLPYLVGEILSKYAHPAILIEGFVLYLVIFTYLYSIITKKNSGLPGKSWLRNLTVFSFFIFLLGYAIFFTNNQVGFSPTGVENRVAIADAVGVAFSVVAGFGWITKLILPDKAAKVIYAVLVSVVCVFGFIIISTLSVFWGQAYQQQKSILSSIHSSMPDLPKNSTVILDGVCPYVGPAIVFEAEWDLRGALQTIYHDPTLRADIVTPRLYVTKKGVNTQIYTFPASYPYKNLIIFNFKNKQTYSIPNVQAARAYLAKHNPDRNNGCPPGSAGNGVSVF